MPVKKPEDKQRHKLIHDLLNVDSVAQAEKITGKEIDADKTTEELGFGIQYEKGRAIRKLMVETGDFAMSDLWSRRKAIMERNGFVQIYQYDFVTRDQYPHSYHVMLEPRCGLVFTQETVHHAYDKEPRSASHGRCHFCWKPDKDLKDTSAGILGIGMNGSWESIKYPDWRSMPGISPGKWFLPTDLYFRGYLHAEAGMIHKLQTLLINGQFMNPWPLWDYGRYPLLNIFFTTEDYEHAEQQMVEGFDQMAFVSHLATLRFDSMPVELQSVMNVRPTWRVHGL